MRELLKSSSSFFLRRQTSILSAAFVIMSTYALSHLMGLFKTRLLLSYFFGSKAFLLDVYYAAFVIPDTIFQLLVIGSLSAAFIPVYTRYLSKGNEKQAWHLASVSLNFVLAIFFVISLGIFIFSSPLCQLIAPGFDLQQISVMSSLLRIMLLAQIFFVISGFLTGILQSHQRFVIPALAPVLYNLGIIIGIIFLSPTLGIYGPAIGVVIGALFHMLIQIPAALRLGFRPSFSFDYHRPGVTEIAKLIPLRSLALGIDQIEQFVAVILASLLSAGSLSLFNIARLLYVIPSSLFGVTLGQAALPVLSRQSESASHDQFAQTLTKTLLQIVFLALPISILFIVLRIPIVRIVFGAKTFPWAATLLTGKVLAILTVSSTFVAAMQLINRGFYAMHNTRTPLIVGLLAACFDVSLSIFFVNVLGWGITGLGLAISLTAVVETGALMFLLIRALRPLNFSLNELWLSLSKIVSAGLATGFALWIPMRLLDRFVFDTTRTIPLIALTAITSLIGLSVYFLLCYLFRVAELTTLVGLLRRLSSWKDIIFPSPKEAAIIPAPDQN
jgi:putative peptidoglycan lipid II flippase